MPDWGLSIMCHYVGRKVNMSDLFEQIWKNSVGFDRLINQKTMYSGNNFPFFNMKKIGENGYTIDLAVAGYGMEDLTITVNENVLTVESKGVQSEGEYIHRGFSSKPFQRTFTLRDNVIVNSATMASGVLSIALEHIVPEQKKPKTIQINVPAPVAKEHRQLLNESSSF